MIRLRLGRQASIHVKVVGALAGFKGNVPALFA
jgi:hypothetical protein